MRSHATDALEVRAAAALRAALEQVSTIKIKDLRSAPQAAGQSIVAHLQVLGHSHTLACELAPSANLGDVERSLAKAGADAARLGAEAAPVLIAPHLSAEAQALCKQNHTGFLDLEGNAHLVIGEVFILRRSLSVPTLQPSSSPLAQRRLAGARAGFPPARAENPAGSSRVPACGG